MNIRVADTQLLKLSFNQDPQLVFFLEISVGEWKWVAIRPQAEIALFHKEVVSKIKGIQAPSFPDADLETLKSAVSGYFNDLAAIPQLEDPIRKWINGTSTTTQLLGVRGEISKEGFVAYKEANFAGTFYGILIGDTLYIYLHRVLERTPVELPIRVVSLSEAKISVKKKLHTIYIEFTEQENIELKVEDKKERREWYAVLEKCKQHSEISHVELTPAQQQVVQQLQLEFSDIPAFQLVNFLMAKDWNLEQAAGLLKADIIWRQDFNLENLKISSIYDIVKKGKLLLYGGRDKEGRPIVVFRARYYDPTVDFLEVIKIGAYYLELACSQAVQKEVSIIVDLDGFDKSNTDFRAYKLIAELLLAHYPSRIGAVWCVQAPWYFRVVFKVVKPWLGADLLSRVHVYSSLEELKSHVEPDQLLAEHGGTQTFDLDKWIEERFRADGVSLSDVGTERAIHPFRNEEIVATYSDAPVTVTSEGAVITGWMKKQGGFVKKFNKRFCVLKGSILYYYRGQTDSKAEGTVPLRGATLAYDSGETFHIITMGAKDCIFQLPDKKSRNWLSALESVVLQHGGKVGRSLDDDVDQTDPWDTYLLDWNLPSKKKLRPLEVSSESLDLLYAFQRGFLKPEDPHLTGKHIVDWIVANTEQTKRPTVVKLFDELFLHGFLQTLSKAKNFEDSSSHLYMISAHSSNAALNLLHLSLAPVPNANELVAVLHQRIVGLIRSFSRGGQLDFDQLRVSREYFDFQIAAGSLQNVDLDAIPSAQRATFFFNLRSLLLLNSLAIRGPIGDVKTRYLSFASDQYAVGGFRFNAEDILHGILRSNKPAPGSLHSQYFEKKDPRIKYSVKDHANDPRYISIVYPSLGYDVLHLIDNYDALLQSAITSFAAKYTKVDDKSVSVPFLFSWVGSSDQEVLQLVASYLDGALKQQVANSTVIAFYQPSWNESFNVPA